MSSNTPVAEMSRWDLGREGGSPFLGSRDEPLGPGREGGSPFLGSRDEPLGPGEGRRQSLPGSGASGRHSTSVPVRGVLGLGGGQVCDPLITPC